MKTLSLKGLTVHLILKAGTDTEFGKAYEAIAKLLNEHMRASKRSCMETKPGGLVYWASDYGNGTVAASQETWRHWEDLLSTVLIGDEERALKLSSDEREVHREAAMFLHVADLVMGYLPDGHKFDHVGALIHPNTRAVLYALYRRMRHHSHQHTQDAAALAGRYCALTAKVLGIKHPG